MSERGYEVIVGLEVHVELKTRTKMFCGCPNAFGGEPNRHTCPVCLGMPGVLPVVNREAVRLATRAAMALNCTINPSSKFDRKQYFYPDLPKGYQISQFDLPLAENGHILIRDNAGEVRRRVRIRRIHMEEDAGKLNHVGERMTDAAGSLVDLNRAGVPLIEIVSDPDMRSAEEARGYLAELRTILSYVDVSDLRMEEGSMRCDANVSLCPLDFEGSLETLPRVEIKNLNSLRNVQRAIEYEVERQAELFARGERVRLETRGFDDAKGRTYSQRSKEEAHDYRYFPEPDLPTLVLTGEWLEQQRTSLPDLPDRLRRDLAEEGLAFKDIEVLVSDHHALAFYRQAASKVGGDRQLLANWMLSDFQRLLNAASLGYDESPVSPGHLVELLELINAGTISGRMAKEVLEAMFESGESAAAVVSRLGMAQITDQDALGNEVQAVLGEHPGVVDDFLGGKEKALGFLVGQVMKRTRGQAKPDLVNQLLRAALEEIAAQR